MIVRLTRSTLRPWQAGDQPSLMYHANNRNIWINVRDNFPFPYTFMDAERWVLHASSNLRDLAFAVTVDDIAVGGIGLIPKDDVYRKTMEIGYWLSEEYWGRGIISEAVGAVRDYAFSHFDIVRLFAEVFEWNSVSMHILEKNKFKCEARLHNAIIKDEKIGDVMIYAITK